MSQDIVPIELGLPQGDLVTLWAPRWREDGEEWEAFLGHEDDLYAFPDAAHLAAFVRTVTEHDLSDHPAWDVVPELSVPELLPDEAHTYEVVVVPEVDKATLDETTDELAAYQAESEEKDSALDAEDAEDVDTEDEESE